LIFLIDYKLFTVFVDSFPSWSDSENSRRAKDWADRKEPFNNRLTRPRTMSTEWCKITTRFGLAISLRYSSPNKLLHLLFNKQFKKFIGNLASTITWIVAIRYLIYNLYEEEIARNRNDTGQHNKTNVFSKQVSPSNRFSILFSLWRSE
jgi:hypothetical protein